MISHINKPWGWEELLEHNNKYVVKKLMMKEGHQCSYQYHEIKRETIYVLEGNLVIVINGEDKIFPPHSNITIEPGVKHRMRAVSSDCVYLESSTSELDDVVRISDDYGRGC